MQFLYSTTDRSFWELARLKLHAAGIRTWESDVDSTITGLGSVIAQREYRLYILDNADASRANEVLLEIGAAPEVPLKLPVGKWVKGGLFLLGLVVVLLLGFWLQP